MKPVYASVYLSNDDTVATEYTTLLPTPGTGGTNQQFYTIATSSDSLLLNTLAESSNGIVRPKAETFGFVIPRAGVYEVKAALRWQIVSGVYDNYMLAIFKNGVAVVNTHTYEHTAPYDVRLNVEYMGPCNTSDVFTFHMSSTLSHPPSSSGVITVENMDGSLNNEGPRNYFSLHNVD